MKNVSVIIPSLNPDSKLNAVVDGVLSVGFSDIILVNDGSDETHMEPFRIAAAHPEVTLLTHEVNKGKGRALKTAFSFILENRPDSLGCITVDGDNQHTAPDILNCAKRMVTEKDKMVLGCRDFDKPDVPAKSKAGNKFTRFIFKSLCGMKITDTQTGLRAFPIAMLPCLVEAKGERFEYETEMFFTLKNHHFEWVEETIETVYIDDNASSHYHPVKDSLKISRIIFRNLFRYVISSCAAFLIDNGIYNLLNVLLASVIAVNMEKSLRLAIATFVARVFSSLFNYTVNRKLVFKSDSSVKQSMLRYYILCVCQVSLSYALVFLFSTLSGAGTGLEAVLKLCVDAFLFLISYQVQQRWVFK